MNHICEKIELWSPCDDLLINNSEQKYALIVLNCQIDSNIDPNKLLNLWKEANLRITVDGGTKRWLKWMEAHNFEDMDIAVPDLITGDMDSLPNNILEYFLEKGSKIIKTPDQNETDYTKSLRELKKHCDIHSIKVNTIFVLADTSGRFDQILANINTLFKASAFLEGKKIYHIASNSITWLLKPGNHKIIIPENLRRDQEWCALIPIGSICTASTTGLKWNLDNSKLSFGELVSTSNTYDGQPFVTVYTDNYLVWSMGIQSIL